MMRKATAILIVLSALCACRNNKTLVGDHPLEMVGTWQLLIQSSCSEYGVRSDTLTLRADGTFDQHVVLNDGKRMELTGQHWKYMANGDRGDVELDKRLELFIPEVRTPDSASRGTFEVLIVEFKSEPVIVLHPDSDCVYVKKQTT